jgi:hypothetical protein
MLLRAQFTSEGQDNDEVTRQVLTISRPISRSSRACAAQSEVLRTIGWPCLLARVDLISRRTAAASERARRVAARSDPSHDFAATAFTVERLMLLARSSSEPGYAAGARCSSKQPRGQGRRRLLLVQGKQGDVPVGGDEQVIGRPGRIAAMTRARYLSLSGWAPVVAAAPLCR